MSAKSAEEKDRIYEWLLEEIYDAQGMGVPVSVDGKSFSVEDAEKLRYVMEDHDYMKSYVSDRSGKIVQIDFDHITSV